MKKTDIAGYNEEYLKDVLCRARGTDWEAAVLRARSASAAQILYARGHYCRFMMQGAFDNKWSTALDSYLRKSVEWEPVPLSVILAEIQVIPDWPRTLFIKLLDRYWAASKEMLCDVVALERFEHTRSLIEVKLNDVPAPSDNGVFQEFLGDVNRPEMSDDVDERAMMMRLLAVQELKKRLCAGYSEEIGVALKTDGRLKLTDEKFERELLPKCFDYLLADKYPDTAKKALFKMIAEPYSFGGSIIEKRYNEYRDKKNQKLIPALKRYNNNHLVALIPKLR